MIIQNFAFACAIGAAIGAGLVVLLDHWISSVRAPWVARIGVMLLGLIVSYASCLAAIFAVKTDVIFQRATDHWTERLNAAMEGKRPDLGFRDLLDHAAWIHAGLCWSAYAFGRWEMEDEDQ